MTLDQALLFHSTGLEEAEDIVRPHRLRLKFVMLVAIAATVSLVSLKRHRAQRSQPNYD